MVNSSYNVIYYGSAPAPIIMTAAFFFTSPNKIAQSKKQKSHGGWSCNSYFLKCFLWLIWREHWLDHSQEFEIELQYAKEKNHLGLLKLGCNKLDDH